MKTLLQILIITIFIISNGYQGLVTSFMLQPVERKWLKSVDDFLNSDIKVHKDFYDEILGMMDSERFREALPIDRKGEIECSIRGDHVGVLCGDVNVAYLSQCKFYRNMIEYFGDGKSYYRMYQIHEVLFTERITLFVPDSHPLKDKFQYLMDISFEAGLPIAWERFYFENLKVYLFDEKKQRNLERDQILDFYTILPFFLILAFGFIMAIFAFFCEIFYHDFFKPLLYEFLLKIWKAITFWKKCET